MEKPFKQPSVMTSQQHFSQVPSVNIERSRFNRSHGHKTTFDAGYLIPVFVDEYLPGDTFHMKATVFARLATPLKPVMDNIYVDLHFFAIPNRLVWDNWQKFMGERPTPDFDPNTLSMPKQIIEIGTTGPTQAQMGMHHYLGLPFVRDAAGATTYQVNALVFRAIKLTFNEWYRDQNLQAPVALSTGDGPDASGGATNPNLALLKRGKRHDYFTSCLPWPQKGDPVVVPIGDLAPVVGIGAYIGSDPTSPAGGADVYETGGPANYEHVYEPTQNAIMVKTQTGAVNSPLDVWADLSQATAISINELRSAFQIQRLLERDARGGTRYIELILAHFGVRSDDARLQRPEYLGGGTQRVNIHPVASTAGTTGVIAAPQGNLAGVGTTLGDASFTKSFQEHGHVIGLLSARADLNYQLGVERMWTRDTRYDFYWPALSHLGEQAVLNREINFLNTSADLDVFGYQEKDAEYRYKPSRITGLFNSYAQGSLDVWHLAQELVNPVLNASFIEEDPPIDRVIAVSSEPHFLADIWFEYTCDRPMPVYAVPGMIDHF